MQYSAHYFRLDYSEQDRRDALICQDVANRIMDMVAQEYWEVWKSKMTKVIDEFSHDYGCLEMSMDHYKRISDNEFYCQHAWGMSVRNGVHLNIELSTHQVHNTLIALTFTGLTMHGHIITIKGRVKGRPIHELIPSHMV